MEHFDASGGPPLPRKAGGAGGTGPSQHSSFSRVAAGLNSLGGGHTSGGASGKEREDGARLHSSASAAALSSGPDTSLRLSQPQRPAAAIAARRASLPLLLPGGGVMLSGGEGRFYALGLALRAGLFGMHLAGSRWGLGAVLEPVGDAWPGVDCPQLLRNFLRGYAGSFTLGHNYGGSGVHPSENYSAAGGSFQRLLPIDGFESYNTGGTPLASHSRPHSRGAAARREYFRSRRDSHSGSSGGGSGGARWAAGGAMAHEPSVAESGPQTPSGTESSEDAEKKAHAGLSFSQAPMAEEPQLAARRAGGGGTQRGQLSARSTTILEQDEGRGSLTARPAKTSSFRFLDSIIQVQFSFDFIRPPPPLHFAPPWTPPPSWGR